jgi:putative ABC transport system ATP-binding protein
MISLVQLTKTFNDGSYAFSVLNQINLQINQGEFVTLVGANGSGKTTLLNIIAGTLKPDAGKITFNNIDVTELAEHQRCKYIARVFQNPTLGTAPDLSILDNFRLAALRTKSKRLVHGINADFIQQVKEKLSWINLGLENNIYKKVGLLSGGQRQAMTVLMSTMDRFDLLLMDEPTAALDPKSAENVLQLTQRIAAQLQVAVVMVTHNLKEALAYGNRLIHMESGTIKQDFNAEQKQWLTVDQMIKWF